MNQQVDSLTIFIPAQTTLDLTIKKGANISVSGIVETYRGKKEIMVSSAEDIHFYNRKESQISYGRIFVD